MNDIRLGRELDARGRIESEIERVQRVMEHDETTDLRGYDRHIGKIKGLRFALEALAPNQEEA